jgi:hypothetical protein
VSTPVLVPQSFGTARIVRALLARPLGLISSEIGWSGRVH